MLYDLNTLEKIEQLRKSDVRVVTLLKKVSDQLPADNRSLDLLRKDMSVEIGSSKIARLKSLMLSTMW